MAMSHVPAIVLILASILFLPVLLGSSSSLDFEYCNKNGYDYATVNNVTVDRTLDHMIGIDVTGSAKKNIPGSNTFVYVSAKLGEIDTELMRYDLCRVASCNTNGEIEAGEFLLRLPEVPDIGNKYLDLTYSTSVRTEKEESPETIFTCASFDIISKPALTLASA